MPFWITLLLLLLLALPGLAQEVGWSGPNLVPNGDFAEGLANWASNPSPSGEVTLITTPAGPALRLVEKGAVGVETQAASAPFPVKGGALYVLSSLVHQPEGLSGFKVTIDWLDAGKRHLRYANDWKGSGAPRTFVPHGGDYRAPEEAAFAQLILGVGSASTVMITQIGLRELGPRLELGSAQSSSVLSRAGKETTISLSVRNTGGKPSASAVVALLGCGESELPDKALRQPLPAIEPGQETVVLFRWIPGFAGLRELRARLLDNEDNLLAESFTQAPVLSVDTTEQAVVLGDEAQRLLFLPMGEEWGPLQLQAKQAGEWVTSAVLPWPGQVTCVGQDGKPELLRFLFTTKPEAVASQVKLSGQASDSLGRTWTLRVTFNFAQGGFLPVVSQLTCDQDAEVLRYTALRLYPGEGSFGAEKDWALFASADMLLAREPSSGRSPRFQPQPGMVTFPYMFVLKSGLSAGLMWDPLQKWDGEQRYPTARFASPNWLEGYDNHLLELALPSVPDWLAENDSAPPRPYQLAAGKTLTLSATLATQAETNFPNLVLDYFRREGFPVPGDERQLPSASDAINLGLKAFTTTLWHPDTATWSSQLPESSGNKNWIAPDLIWNLAKVIELQEQDQLELDPAEVIKMTAILQTALERAKPEGRGHIFSRDLSWQWGLDPTALMGEYGAAKASLTEQRADGSFPYHEIIWQGETTGKEGDTSLGTTAMGALPILTWAEYTGDTQFIAAGLKACDFMATLERPEGAEVWEIQLHDPNLRAAGLGIRCCLAAWRLTKEPKYLDQARYWATASLPFIYWWSYPDWPLMFGSTVSVLNHEWWPGRPVQWVGLEYATALFDLAETEEGLGMRTFPWGMTGRYIADAGHRWQYTEGEQLGLYPDFMQTGTQSPGGPGINPLILVKHFLRMLGEDEPWMTSTATLAGKEVRWTTAAKVTDAGQLAGGGLKLVLEKPQPQSYLVLLAGLGKPTGITCEGEAVPEVAEFDDAAPSGWVYVPEPGLLFVKVSPAEVAQTLEIVAPLGQ